MPNNPPHPNLHQKNKQPEDPAWKVQLLAQHRGWLDQPMTKRFLAALEADANEIFRRAGKHAVDHATGIGNAREHNNLVKAQTHLQIIDKYANRNAIPDSYTNQRPGAE